MQWTREKQSDRVLLENETEGEARGRTSLGVGQRLSRRRIPMPYCSERVDDGAWRVR
jgi:hypothetical protein